MNPTIPLVLLSLLLSLMGGCAVNPVTGKNEISLYSEASEINMGEQHYLGSQQSQGGTYITDPELSRYVNQVGQRLAAVSDRPLPYEFVVLNNSVPNAWALPGGKIAVNRGLLLELDNEAELAAVLGHEIIHAAAKHGIKQTQMGMGLQGLLIGAAILTSESDYSNYIVGGAQIGAQLISQTYGRGAELESDRYGIEYMARAGYNPAAAITLQEKFVQLSDGRQTNWLEGLFTSHPPSQARVDANRATVAALGVKKGELNRNQFLAATDFIRRNKPAYDLAEGSVRLAAEGKERQALDDINRAIREVPGEPAFLDTLGDIHYSQQRFDQAEAAYTRALALDNNYFDYHLGRGLTALKQGQQQLARTHLQRSNELLPTAIANHELGQLSLAAGDTVRAKQYFQTVMSSQGNIGASARAAFTRLDLPENPQNYVGLGLDVQQGRLLANLKNQTLEPLAEVQIEITANVNGNNLRRVLTTPLGAGQAGTIDTGMRFTEADIVTAVDARIIAARLARTH